MNLLECSICFEKHLFLKYLSCRHSFCLNCLKKLKKYNEENGETIVCPLDRLKTVLKNGTNEYNLRTNFILVCDNCSDETIVSKCWWCSDCEDSICGYDLHKFLPNNFSKFNLTIPKSYFRHCAMKKHNNVSHKCNEWENYDIVKKCVSILQPYVKQTDDIDEDNIHNFCIQLENELKERFKLQVECKKFLSNIENVFGHVTEPASRGRGRGRGRERSISTNSKKFGKNLTTISKVLNYSSDDINSRSVNIEILKQVPNAPLVTKKISLPDVSDVVLKYFDEPKVSVRSLQWAKTISTKFKNPICLCPTYGGIVILTSEGIFSYCDDFNTSYTLRGNYSKAKFVVNHELRKTVIVSTVTKDNGNEFLVEYSLPKLEITDWCRSLPRDSIDEAPFLIAVCFDGRLVGCQGINGKSKIWILKSNCWISVWGNTELEGFQSLHLIKFRQEDHLYFECKTVIYEFLVTDSQTRLLRSIKYPNERHLFVLLNELYYFTDKAEKFCSVFNDKCYDTNLSCSDNCKKLFASTNIVAYYLNCDNNELKIGLII